MVAGKTNIMNSFRLFETLTSEVRTPSSRAGSTGESLLKARFDIDGKTAILTARVTIHTDEHNRDRIVDADESWYLKDWTGSAKRVRIPLQLAPALTHGRRMLGPPRGVSPRLRRQWIPMLLGDMDEQMESALVPIRAAFDFLSSIQYYSASQYTNPSACPVSLAIDKHVAGRQHPLSRRVGRPAEEFLNKLYAAYNEQSEGYFQFLDIVGPNGIGLIDEISFNAIPTSSIEHSVRVGGQVLERKSERLLIIPQFRIGNNTLSPNQLSEGSFKTIALLFSILTERSSLLLLEEPEVCVHQGLLSSILELIKQFANERQIIISTHSDFVLDHVPPESVYAVSRTSDGSTKVTPALKSKSGSELVALKEYLRSEGSLGEYWKHGDLE